MNLQFIIQLHSQVASQQMQIYSKIFIIWKRYFWIFKISGLWNVL